ncbi:Glycosyl transferase family 2 [Dyadobacter sp. SG02]|uniref:glycosyltransferase n=1 Tax=Dyadobacter sp. SG02 TaxID=1855291 RepID=UPI0008AD5390|nr:glycosyltransferase [Dyadobacter sp. SG02]SEI45631.1 Glycosyl transferase family 2 [Dyadobacter sp. SG02]
MGFSGTLAPIVLFCYNRPAHLRQTVESLRLNTLAPESELFVYSDGPKNEDDRQKVREVRNYLSTVTGFRAIHITEAEKNKGLAASVIEGVSFVLSKYPNVIVLEDDMLSATDFLSFMNQALDVYAERTDIFSVTGYTPPVTFPENYPHDLYLVPRASSWGWGTWAHKWAKADWQVKGFSTLKNDADHREAFNKGGDDLWPMLVKQQKGVIDSWAIRWTYSQFQNNAYGLYPVHSKIKNIGTDGSGTNFTFKSGEYGHEMTEGGVQMPAGLMPDEKMIRAFGEYYRLPFLLKIKNRVKYGI